MFTISSWSSKYHIITLTGMGLSEGLLNTRKVMQTPSHQFANEHIIDSTKYITTSSQISI